MHSDFAKLLLSYSEVLQVETSISLTTCFDVALRNVEEANRPLMNRPLWVANLHCSGAFIRKHHAGCSRRIKETLSEPV